MIKEEKLRNVFMEMVQGEVPWEIQILRDRIVFIQGLWLGRA